MKQFVATLLLLVAGVLCVNAFLPPSFQHTSFKTRIFESTTTSQEEKTRQDACYYREPITKQWQPRIPVESLTVGQHLNGTLVQELFNGKTGPKLFFDCGVASFRKGKWQICNGMMRLSKNKDSVVRKRATRLRRKAVVELQVSRIYPQQVQFEVVVADSPIKEPRHVVSASSLQKDQELVGTVTRVMPYGVFVDVGANRRGLLHIQKVADLNGCYIDKEKGLEEAGLERGARIRVQVSENEGKRLFLDFTNDVKREAQQEAKAALKVDKVEVKQQQEEEEESSEDSSYGDLSEEEVAAWAAYGAMGDQQEEGDYDQEQDEDDYYDEDRDIEDALGLGSY